MIRFPDLDSKGYDNTAFVAANFGFKIQIDGTGNPDGAPKHTTGAIYNEVDQTFSLTPARAIGMWNTYQIRVDNQLYTVVLNGVQTTRFENHYADRGLPSPSYIGVQTHSGRVSFRNIRIRALIVRPGCVGTVEIGTPSELAILQPRRHSAGSAHHAPPDEQRGVRVLAVREGRHERDLAIDGVRHERRRVALERTGALRGHYSVLGRLRVLAAERQEERGTDDRGEPKCAHGSGSSARRSRVKWSAW